MEPKIPDERLIQLAQKYVEHCKLHPNSPTSCRIAAEAAWGYVQATAREATRNRYRDVARGATESEDEQKRFNERVHTLIRGLDRRLYGDYRTMQDALHGNCFYDGRVYSCDVKVIEPLVKEAEQWVKDFKEKLQKGKAPPSF